MAPKQSGSTEPKKTRMSATDRLRAELAKAELKELDRSRAKLTAAKVELDKASIALVKATARHEAATIDVVQLESLLSGATGTDTSDVPDTDD